MNVLITGRPGVGKSFVTQALAQRGVKTYDLEEIDGAIRLEDKASGQPVDWPVGFVDWSKYARRMKREVIQEFLGSIDQPSYVSGSANNQVELYDMFDQIIVLTLRDPAVLRHRLETRNAHEHGQTQANIDLAVERFLDKQAELLSFGGVAIDNDRPIDDVVNDILQLTT